MTPTEMEAVERHKKFRAHIAQKAAELEARAVAPPVDPTPNAAPWVHWIKGAEQSQPEGLPAQIWFSVIDDLGPRSEPSIALIQKTCCIHFAIPRREYLSHRRTSDVVYARQVGMFLAKSLTGKSLPEIGRRFGNRDHTTVLYAVRKIGLQSRQDPEIACDIAALTAEIERFTI